MRIGNYISIGVMVLLALGCDLNAPDAKSDPADANNSKKQTELAGKHSFSVEIPESSDWIIIHDGPMRDAEDAYALVALDPGREFRLSVTVLPALKDYPELEDMQPGWERGFLKNATRKKSSEFIRIAGRDAFKLTAEALSRNGKPSEIIGILVVTNEWQYTIGMTRPGNNVYEEPEVQQFLESFSVTSQIP